MIIYNNSLIKVKLDDVRLCNGDIILYRANSHLCVRQHIINTVSYYIHGHISHVAIVITIQGVEYIAHLDGEWSKQKRFGNSDICLIAKDELKDYDGHVYVMAAKKKYHNDFKTLLPLFDKIKFNNNNVKTILYNVFNLGKHDLTMMCTDFVEIILCELNIGNVTNNAGISDILKKIKHSHFPPVMLV